MQGKKDYQEKLFTHFQLSDHVPKENFYRRLKESIDLSFLYDLTKGYYGDCGKKSIDPVVFYKLCLVGYLENIIRNRQLMSHCSMRMDILYYDIGAYHAHKKNQYLPELVKGVKRRLQGQGLLLRNIVADTGYSSWENYAFLEGQGL